MEREVPKVALVAGAAGTLGQCVVHDLAQRGIEVVGMGRTAPPGLWPYRWITGDMIDTEALRAAVRDVDTVVNCATDALSPTRDIEMLRGLLNVCGSLGRHIVHVSIAGIERADKSPYYAGKLEGERLLRSSGVPHTLMRSTQFHPFVLSMLQRLEFGPLVLCPPLRFQPVDPVHVADLIGRCVTQRAVVNTTVCGPELLSVRQLATTWLDARQVRRFRLSIPALGQLAPFTALKPVSRSGGGATWANWIRSRRWHASQS